MLLDELGPRWFAEFCPPTAADRLGTQNPNVWVLLLQMSAGCGLCREADRQGVLVRFNCDPAGLKVLELHILASCARIPLSSSYIDIATSSACGYACGHHKVNTHSFSAVAVFVYRGRCSVLIKVTPDLSDLLMGHVTWWTYTGMTRLYKHYTFNLNGKQYKTTTTSMSSYPGNAGRQQATVRV